jgi:mRNA-degrading endonuclease RelE of RelBE toxin-antitoxin system
VKLIYTQRFRRAYAEALPHIQRACDRRLALLLRDLRHPSLRAKKYDEAKGIWQARVDGGWRLYFVIEGDTYVLLALIPHPK